MSDNKSKTYSHEPDFEGGTKEIKAHFFYYGRGMQQKCLTSSKMYLNYIGTKYGESVKHSIEMNQLIVTEMPTPKVYADEAATIGRSKDKSIRIYRKVIQPYGANVHYLYIMLSKEIVTLLQCVPVMYKYCTALFNAYAMDPPIIRTFHVSHGIGV
jgi:hypothetical protein